MGILDFFARGSERDRFARLVVRRLQANGWPHEIVYDKEQFAITLDPDRNRMFLENVFRDWSAAEPGDRQTQIDKIIASTTEINLDDAFESCAPLLLPIIRNRSQVENLWLNAGFGMTWERTVGARRPLGDCLAVIPAIDRPSSISVVDASHLEKWERTLDEVLAIAVENLRAISPLHFQKRSNGYFVSDYGDYHDASRLLLPHLFAQLDLKGDAVAVVVSRSAVVVAGSEDRDALEAMAVAVEEALQAETRPIGSMPLILRDQTWRPLNGGPNIPIALNKLRVRHLMQDAADQKIALEAYFERCGRDVYVAALGSLGRDERTGTFAVWPRDVPTLLPRADAIALQGEEGGRPLTRSWEDVTSICGPWSEEPSTYPPRYVVERSPRASDWDRIAACQAPDWFPDLKADDQGQK